MQQVELPDETIIIDDMALPKVDFLYSSTHHNDKPFMTYPNELILDFNSRYIITSYARIYDKMHDTFRKSIKDVYIPKVIKDNFPDYFNNNPYTKYNLLQTSSLKSYYKNRDKKLAYQRKYQKDHYVSARTKAKEVNANDNH